MKDKLILGTVQMGLPYGINNLEGKISPQQSIDILNLAFDSGIHYLDTAEAYGNAHKIIGGFHNNYTDKKFEIITKLPHDFDGSLNDKIQDYLIDLSVERLHVLLFHSFQSYQNNSFLIKELNELKKKGKVKHIGVSLYTNDELKEVIDDPDIDVIQLPFNLFDNSNLRGELLVKAKEKGKIIHTRSCFLQGLFYMSVDSDNKVVQALKSELLKVHGISEENNLSMAQLALGYCLQQKSIDNVLIGVDNAGQLYDNIKDAETFLTDDIVKEINAIKIKDSKLLNPVFWNTL